jgi:hypothetical protein
MQTTMSLSDKAMTTDRGMFDDGHAKALQI